MSAVNITAMAWGSLKGEWKSWVISHLCTSVTTTSTVQWGPCWTLAWEGEQETRAEVACLWQSGSPSPQQHYWNQSLAEFPTKPVKSCNFPQVFPHFCAQSSPPSCWHEAAVLLHVTSRFGTKWKIIQFTRSFVVSFSRIRWAQTRQMKTKG